MQSTLRLNAILEQFNTSSSYINIEYVVAGTLIFCVTGLVFGQYTETFDLHGLIKHGLLKSFYSNIFHPFIPDQFNRYCHVFLVVFVAIFSINVYGLFTWCFTLTGCLLFTATSAFTFMFWTFVSFIVRLDKNFLAHLSPIGLPGFLGKSIVFTDLLSYFGRFVSLTARLFINILSGHVIAKLICTSHKMLFWHIFLNCDPAIYYLGIMFISSLVISVAVLEIFVAVLQAYIFVFLLSIYVSEAF